MSSPVFSADGDGAVEATRVVLGGGVIVYPTETVYGLGGDPMSAEIVARIGEIKGRGESKPILVLTDTWDRVATWIAGVAHDAETLMSHEPPLPVTFLFPAGENAPEWLIGEEGLIGIRKTTSAFCLDLIGEIDRPLLSTSANRTGRDAPARFSEIEPFILDKVDATFRSDAKREGVHSTIVRAAGDRIEVLREGGVSEEDLWKILGESNSQTG